ncbi:hypothetical protein FN846DRAFT_908455 [Sphaerosporella brunnea]|uniref:HNH nuclease domain-containing protein n=1 Tax=Sphaerosporella brunnea TaxID=1250544 RepID=A0A5J5ESI7_9PEZI|nr:hypothetical protein FN846DRAFT_908455 [Sphaerosporella brunnea]
MVCAPITAAAHIVPVGRPDIWSYGTFLHAICQERTLFRAADSHILAAQNAVENGIMLRQELHSMLYRFFWGVHARSMRLVVFVAVQELIPFHGMVLRPRQRIGWPLKAVWNWQWQQCVVRWLRGQGELSEFKYYDSDAYHAVVVSDEADMDHKVEELYDWEGENRGRSRLRRSILCKFRNNEDTAGAQHKVAFPRVEDTIMPQEKDSQRGIGDTGRAIITQTRAHSASPSRRTEETGIHRQVRENTNTAHGPTSRTRSRSNSAPPTAKKARLVGDTILLQRSSVLHSEKVKMLV